MKNIVVCSHFHSCNYGDKRQSETLVKNIEKLDVKLIKTNFSRINDIDKRKQIYNEGFYDIEYILEKNIFCNIFIITTGSIGCNSSYNILIKKLLKENLIEKLILVGGFSGDVVREDLHKIDYLYEEKVLFFSRTDNDLKLYKLIGDYITNKNIKSKFSFEGELIAINSLNYLDNLELKKYDKKIKVGILSFYLFKFCFKSYKNQLVNLVRSLDKIIIVDTFTAKFVKEYLVSMNFKGKIVATNQTKIIIDNLLNAKVVFSSRLHGGLISILMNIPTYFIPSDNSKNNICYIPSKKKSLGSFKYHSLSNISFFPNETLAKILYVEDIDNFINLDCFYNPHIDSINKYKLKCKNLEEKIISMIQG